MRGLDAKIVFDPLNKSQTPDGELLQTSGPRAEHDDTLKQLLQINDALF